MRNFPIRTTPSTVKRIVTTPSTLQRVDPALVAAALGAEPTGDKLPSAGPLTLYALRSEVYRRRKSSGGRPGIEGTDSRAKIPVNAGEWEELEALATTLTSEGNSPSAGQVASVLLSMALESVRSETNRRELGERLSAQKGSKT